MNNFITLFNEHGYVNKLCLIIKISLVCERFILSVVSEIENEYELFKNEEDETETENEP